ncbi:energy transducer TonB [Stenotrophomonas sp. 278]|uniref:energy transducer TonB n=1 Tax=Stenotrophomonas sp. 278 TaxID=2479851 RepID=UPI000F68FE4B|nr:energy transducer TonB [Stenotrophomonas sp. 278]RRU19363.1 hypothetical protein EGJ34_05800 [Stenotrophomonas sp. 278]
MRAVLTTLLVALLLSLPTALAQQGFKPFVFPQRLEPGTKYYPAELAETGAQGSTVIKVTRDPDHYLVDPVVVTSSKSKVLDDLALRYVRDSKLRASEDGDPEVELHVSVIFARDTEITLEQKTCAQFNTDLAFTRGNDPRSDAGRVHAYMLGTGLMMFGPGATYERTSMISLNLRILAHLIEEKCAASPEAKFFETLKGFIPQE